MPLTEERAEDQMSTSLRLIWIELLMRSSETTEETRIRKAKERKAKEKARKEKGRPMAKEKHKEEVTKESGAGQPLQLAQPGTCKDAVKEMRFLK